ncbi:hypothetical protein DFH29DRAFT_875727 [Suillus ampliporus]|nr:hypothetical protein DFH29DRAFT_875727 [Suillus ampliporus]
MSMIAKKGHQQGQEGYDATGAICPVHSMDPTWHQHCTSDDSDVDDDCIACDSLANISGQIGTPKVEKSAKSQMNFGDVNSSCIASTGSMLYCDNILIVINLTDRLQTLLTSQTLFRPGIGYKLKFFWKGWTS